MPNEDEKIDVSSKIRANDKGEVILSKEFFNQLVDEYSDLSSSFDDNSEAPNVESIFGRKHTYCVTTGDGQKHQFREYPALAHAKCIQLGFKYGTPASMRRGHCD